MYCVYCIVFVLFSLSWVGFGALSGSRSVLQIVHVHLTLTTDTLLFKKNSILYYAFFFSSSSIFSQANLYENSTLSTIFCVLHAPMRNQGEGMGPIIQNHNVLWLEVVSRAYTIVLGWIGSSCVVEGESQCLPNQILS